MSWWIFGVGLILCAGYAKLSSVLLNWLVAHHLPKKILYTFEAIHFASLPLYGILLIAIQLRSGIWLVDRSPAHVSAIEAVVLAIGAIGFLLLIGSTIGWQTYRPPQCQVSNHSRLIDFRKSTADQAWQDLYIGHGKGRRLAMLPGNGQFTLEVSTKTYTLPRLPKEWDGLSLVHITDVHYTGAVSRAYFEAVCDEALALQPDLFVFTGDLFDDLRLLDWFPSTFGKLRAPLGQFFILGNHDWYSGAEQVREELLKDGWLDVSSGPVELRSSGHRLPLVIAGDETPWMGIHPDFSQIPADAFRILLSHSPDNIEWAREQQIDLMLSGHTHGGQIRLPVLGPVYSPSKFSCRYASGVFWRSPTLLYVSRGISGREPIRYNCPPELTKLILRSGASGSADANFKSASLA